MLPSIDAIRSQFPDAVIDWVVNEKNFSLLECAKGINNILSVDTSLLFSGHPLKQLKFAKELKNKISKSYDLILLAHRNVSYPILLNLIGLKNIVQIKRSPIKIWDKLLVDPVEFKLFSCHESLKLKELTRKGLAKLKNKEVSDIQWEWNFDHLKQPKSSNRSIGIHLGGGKNTKVEFTLKRWPFMKELISQIDRPMVLFGSSDEMEDANKILKTLPPEVQSRIENCVGKLNLKELISKISEIDCFIGPDSGPLHIADALGVKCIGLYGPTSEISWGLLNTKSIAAFEKVSCHPCYKDDGTFPECLNSHQCMNLLTPSKILKLI